MDVALHPFVPASICPCIHVALHPFVPAADIGRDTAQAPSRSRDHALQGTKPLSHVINQKLLKAPMWQVGQEFCKRGDPRPGSERWLAPLTRDQD